MLTLPIKRKWFDMICSGEKQEEYREITPYYTQRFKSIGLLDEHGNPRNTLEHLILRNGYGKSRPEVMVLVRLKIGTGHPRWGAEENKWYYVLEINNRHIKMYDNPDDNY